MTSNPYAPPTTEADAQLDVGTVRIRRGPALYIGGFGLLGGFGAIPFLAIQNPFGFALVLLGCIAGGVFYRVRSRNWPHDPTIPPRQWLYAALAVGLPPGTLFLFAGPNWPGPAIALIGLIVGLSVACGILISGSRRLNAAPKNAEASDPHSDAIIGSRMAHSTNAEFVLAKCTRTG